MTIPTDPASPIPTETADTVDKLEQTWAATSSLCADLSEDEWNMPTDCPGWTVKDNVSHLIGTERLLHGLPRTDHRSPTVDYVKNPIGEMNENEVDARRSSTGAKVLAEWNTLVDLRLATLRGGDAEYFAAAAMTPTGPGTVADFLHIRVLDCWAHEQDIRRALDRPGGFDTAAAGHTIDRLTKTLPIVIGKRAGTPEGSAVTIDITGPVSRTLTYEVSGGRAGLVELPSQPPIATVQLDTETFTVLALGRRPAAECAHAITIDGDTALGQRVVEQLTMMI